jgi:hypothetical protein
LPAPLPVDCRSSWPRPWFGVCVGGVCVGAEPPAPLPALATSNERVDVLMRELATLKDRMNQLEQNSYVGDSIDLDDSFDGEVNLDEEEDAPPTHVLARR